MRHVLPLAVFLVSVSGRATACQDGYYEHCFNGYRLTIGNFSNCVCLPNSGTLLEPFVEQTCRGSPHFWQAYGAIREARQRGAVRTYEECEALSQRVAASAATEGGPVVGDLYGKCGTMICTSHFVRTDLAFEQGVRMMCESVLRRFSLAEQAQKKIEYDCRLVTDPYGKQRCEENIAAGNLVLRGLSAEGHSIGCETPPTGTPNIR